VTWPAPAPGLPTALASLFGGGESVEIDGEAVDAVPARELYGPRGFTPLWVDGGEDRLRVLVEVLGRAGEHGLDPSRYHLAAIQRRLGSSSEQSRAELELLSSDAVMRYGAHVSSG